MPGTQPVGGKKYYTAAQANAALPLVRAIVGDITELARDLRERHERLARVQVPARGAMGEAYEEEVRQMQAELERGQERMEEYEEELKRLGVELKDYHSGLIDFLCWMDNREVYLCWRMGEPEVGYWHELDAGFAGRKKLQDGAARVQKTF